MCPTPGIMKGPRMINLLSKTNEELMGMIISNPTDVNETYKNAVIRRVLKDRLEGLDEVLKSEMLHDKIVSA